MSQADCSRRYYERHKNDPDYVARHVRNAATYNRSETCVLRAQRYKINHPEAYSARMAVSHAIREGYLVRPIVCSLLVPLNSYHGGRPGIQAHHHLGYALEHHLDVIWLCQRCHITLDRSLGHIDNATQS